MTKSIRLEYFSKRDSVESYQAYLRIKYQVFAVEHGWPLHGDETGKKIAQEDPYDEAGRFLLARTEAGEPVGVLRGLPVREGFPHCELFSHHSFLTEVSPLYPNLCTLNAWSVLSPYRHKKYRIMGLQWEASIGRLLMLTLMHLLAQEGMRAAIATAQGFISAHVFRRLGFFVIDRPTKTHLHPNLLMTNIGTVFGSQAHVQAQQDCRMDLTTPIPEEQNVCHLLQYFQECEKRSLGGAPLEKFFESIALQRGGT